MGYRSITFTVVNLTEENLVLSKKNLDHGEWKDDPESIPNGGTGFFMAESKGGSLKGVEGYVRWTGGTSMGTYEIYFEKPQDKGSTIIKETVPAGYTYTQEGDPGGHDSSLKVTFKKL